MPNTEHFDAFLDAPHRRDVDALATHLAEDVVIRSPIVAEPFHGKATVKAVLTHVLQVIDSFEVKHIFRDGEHFAILLGIETGAATIDGVDYLHLNDAGLVDSMTIMWRPLPALVEVQNRLAPAIGIPALKLVPA